MRLALAAAALALTLVLPAAAAEPPVTLAGTDVVTGKRFTTAAYRGQPVVVVLWSSW